MPHICMDEVLAFLALAPWVGAWFVWIRMKWRARSRGLRDHV